MKKVIVHDEQSLLDIAIQETGSVDGLVDIALRNGKNVTSPLQIGEVIIVEDSFVRNKEVVTYFADKIVTSGTVIRERTVDFDGADFDYVDFN